LYRILPPSLHLFDKKALKPYKMANGRNERVQQDPLGPLHPPMFDLLYTWVNGSDPLWQFNKEVYELKDSDLHVSKRFIESLGSGFVNRTNFGIRFDQCTSTALL